MKSEGFYHRTQSGTVGLTLFAALFTLSLLSLVWKVPQDYVHGTVLVLLLSASVGGAILSILTIRVDEGRLTWWFGPGILKKEVSLEQVKNLEVVEIPWYHGLGIRRTPDGWLYRVGGSRAVRITLDDGSRLNLGSTRPHELAQAISSREERAPSS